MKNDQAEGQNIHRDIIEDCKKKDRQAQFRVYKLYYKNMYNLSLRIVNNTQEAEDIMQESFLSAFDNLGSYSGKSSFGAWLKRIVINKSLDALKKNKYDLINLDDNLAEPADTSEEDSELIKVEAEKINKGIKLLPDGYRIIMSLYLLEGYDHEEIADILSISSSTSRSQYARAKKKLVEILNKNKP